jgi:hypothetical protein
VDAISFCRARATASRFLAQFSPCLRLPDSKSRARRPPWHVCISKQQRHYTFWPFCPQANFVEFRHNEVRRILLPCTQVNKGIKRAWLSSGKDRVLRGFGISALTPPVLFGGEALSLGGQRPLPYDQKCFAGVRGQSRRSRCHPPRGATSRAVRDP